MNLVHLFKEPPLRFIDSFYCFLYSIPLISDLNFIISCLRLGLDLIGSCFFKFLNGTIKLFICNLSDFFNVGT